MAGAVETAPDPFNWRNVLSRQLLELDIIPLNPLIKPSWFKDFTVDDQYLFKEVIRKQHNSLTSESNESWIQNKTMRQFCLHLIASANFVIVKLDKTFTVGTFFELSLCKYKPVFILTDDPALSTWLIAEFDLEPCELKEYFHKDIDSLISYLRQVDGGNIIPSNKLKWCFMTYRCR
jgi:hypothetical protein